MAEAIADYDTYLDASFTATLEEMDNFFAGDSKPHQALRRITSKLDGLDVSYTVVGAMAMNGHGFRRTTDDVDLLVTKDGLQRVHEALDGLGYLPVFRGSKHLRDTQLGVRIEFLTTGDYPGDGKPKPIAFPDPRDASVIVDGIPILRLPILIDLKLASGMTNPGRLKDLADVQELIRHLNLDAAFAEQLDPYVRRKYLEIRSGLEADTEH